MKKLLVIFALTTMLVVSVFGQQPRPARAKSPKAVTVKPDQPATATTVVPARPTVDATVPIAPAASAPTPVATTVDAAPVAPATVVQSTPSPVQSPAARTIVSTPVAPFAATQATTPLPSSRIVPSRNVTVAPAPTTHLAPAMAMQEPSVTLATPPRITPTQARSVTAQQQPAVSTTNAPAAREPEYISEKGFKGKVIEVKYREPSVLIQALGGLGSGFKGAQIRPSDEFNTITVRDFPENIATIEEAIKRLDTPQAPRPDIEFRIQVLIASNTAAQGEEYTSDLNDVVKQLQSTLKYKNYSLMFSSAHRTKEGFNGVRNNGVAESKLFNVSVPSGNQIFYEYDMSQIRVDSATSAGTTVQVGNFSFGLRIPLVIGAPNSPIQYQNVGFRSPVSLREGEKVVVGTTTMGDKGLIVVLTAKVNK
jgi:hypothetical protein